MSHMYGTLMSQLINKGVFMKGRECLNCSNSLEGKSSRAITCSVQCRKELSRSKPVNEGVPVSMEDRVYEFRVTYGGVKGPVRRATSWTDVPLGGEPVMKKGFPDKPEYMNNRQYFLWYENGFKVGEDGPVIKNPRPVYDRVEYKMGGEASNMWANDKSSGKAPK